MAHLCIINSTEGATWFNNFEISNILCQIQQTTKQLADELKTRLIHE